MSAEIQPETCAEKQPGVCENWEQPEVCENWDQTGSCRFGESCRFVHNRTCLNNCHEYNKKNKANKPNEISIPEDNQQANGWKNWDKFTGEKKNHESSGGVVLYVLTELKKNEEELFAVRKRWQIAKTNLYALNLKLKEAEKKAQPSSMALPEALSTKRVELEAKIKKLKCEMREVLDKELWSDLEHTAPLTVKAKELQQLTVELEALRCELKQHQGLVSQEMQATMEIIKELREVIATETSNLDAASATIFTKLQGQVNLMEQLKEYATKGLKFAVGRLGFEKKHGHAQHHKYNPKQKTPKSLHTSKSPTSSHTPKSSHTPRSKRKIRLRISGRHLVRYKSNFPPSPLVSVLVGSNQIGVTEWHEETSDPAFTHDIIIPISEVVNTRKHITVKAFHLDSQENMLLEEYLIGTIQLPVGILIAARDLEGNDVLSGTYDLEHHLPKKDKVLKKAQSQILYHLSPVMN